MVKPLGLALLWGMIYLCRHGETEFNRERRLQGRLDSQLTDLGRLQAGAMGELIYDLISQDPLQPWRIVSSPQGRALATAEIISARLGLPVVTDDRLMEISVGAWEGSLVEDLIRADPSLMSDLDWHTKAPGGERYHQVVARIEAWLEDHKPLEEKHLIVISHGFAGRMFRGSYENLSKQARLKLAVPQDAIFRLQNGQVERLVCAPIHPTPSSGSITETGTV